MSEGTLSKFLGFVQETCPWFPEEGTINLQTWHKVGKALRDRYTGEGPQQLPVYTFTFWNLIKECLDSANPAEHNLDCMSSVPRGPPTLEGYSCPLPSIGEPGDGQLSPEEKEQLKRETRQDERGREDKNLDKEDDDDEEVVFNAFAHKMSLKRTRKGVELPPPPWQSSITYGAATHRSGTGAVGGGARFNHRPLLLHGRSQGHGSLLSKRLY